MRLLFVLGAFVFIVFCANKNEIREPQSTHIRVINSTDVSFTNVVLFSMKFNDLRPKDTSEYKMLDYDPLKDDPLIYCSAAGTRYARYLQIPEAYDEKYSYVIDSIQDGIVYVSSQKGTN
ncbi:hypothetical protein EHW67_07695 [Arenibacter aquaticus]|uniref:Uncharacterized protein n=1 Tax=Arenibacter aquaticus TaxID=2489054 RepID=A0A430K408_9FLAO|nr:hypothetical protein [Arenibacter aquaticus]RTE53810.1 hypothetical protein EHW67_07695 [Arenibacter aquaticus]